MREGRAVVEQLIAAFNAHDADASVGLFAGDARVVTATGRLLDLPGLNRLLSGTFRAFPDASVRVARWVIDGDTIATEEVMEGTHKGPFAGLDPSGQQVEIRAAHVTRVVDGRIVERVSYHDTAALLRQLERHPA